MNDFSDIPKDLVEQVKMMEGILIARATSLSDEKLIYEKLRKDFIANSNVNALLPAFVRAHRNLDSFWQYIKNLADTYAERRQIISMAFTTLIDFLESRIGAPSDQIASDSIATFDPEGVLEIWTKALARREADPEGAITAARTLLETVTKRILNELGRPHTEHDDLPKLFLNASEALNLAPSQHSEPAIKAILGSGINLVNGLGTLRNRLSDPHGRGEKLPVKPSARHAKLAVNTSGAIATFLVETYLEQKGTT